MKFRNGIRLSARYNRLRKTFACSLTVWTTLNSRERPSADFVAPALGGPCRSFSEREKATNNFEATLRIASSQLARLNCFELTLKNIAPRGNGVRPSSRGERNRKSQSKPHSVNTASVTRPFCRQGNRGTSELVRLSRAISTRRHGSTESVAKRLEMWE